MRKRVTSALAGMFGVLAVILVGLTYNITPAGAIANNGKVITIIVENHSYEQMQSGLPTLWNYAQLHTYFTNYLAIRHPSEPNYLAIAGGSTFGDTTDHSDADDFPVNDKSVIGQANNAGSGSFHGTGKSYIEGMVDNCDLTSGGTGTVHYEVKHNPQAFFTLTSPWNERNICALTNVSAGTTSSGHLKTDVDNGTLPNASFLIPDNCHSGHEPCDFTDTEPWLAGWLNYLTSGPDYDAGKLAIVVTADEDDSVGENRVMTVVIAKQTEGDGANSDAMNHYSLSGFMSDATGSAHLHNAATAPNMRASLGFPTPK